MSRSHNQHAVVIGGSLAGLLAAQVLSKHFEQVTIVERDVLPKEATSRNGVPQARHIHILLVRGMQILAELFPDFEADLVEFGAVKLDWSQDLRLLLPTGWVPPLDTALVSYMCSRDLIEWLVRRRLLANESVTFCTGLRVTNLSATDDKRRITGVSIAGQAGIEADLVVDASGRSSKLPTWLTALGYDAPEVTAVNAHLGYATRWYRVPDKRYDWKALLLGAAPPHMPRSGGIMHAEGNRWVVSLAGRGGDFPPTDEAGFFDFAQSLADSSIYEAIKTAVPLTPVYGYRRTENQQRHYERLTRFPEGLVAVGDSVCAFNPIYGQGMTTCAMGAQTLDECLQQYGVSAALTAHYPKRLAKVNETPWLLATGEDFRWLALENDERSFATKFRHRYVDLVNDIIPHDRHTARTFLEVTHLLAPPTRLAQPAIMGKALWAKVSKQYS